jgi:hypothetical protein
LARFFEGGLVEDDRLAPVGAEIAPGWIGGDDEFQFANAEPAFEDFLAVDGRGDRGEAFEIDELGDVVFGGVAIRVVLLFVLANSDFQISGDADVELFEAIGEDVDIGVLGHFLSHRAGQRQDKDKYRGPSFRSG